MTEADWNSCSDPQAMLAFLRGSGKLPERKARLFAVACCRHAWGLIRPGPSRRAVSVAERYADGLVGPRSLATARAAARELAKDTGAWAAVRAAEPDAHTAACEAARRTARTGNLRWQPDLLRDLFGNPFRPQPPIAPAWLAWQGGTVAKLAGLVYEER